jgi:3'-5' exoribonuclease
MQPDLKSLRAGNKVDHFVLLKKMETKITRQGKEYLDMELADKSGSINGKFWENFSDFKDVAREGMLLHVRGDVVEFNGTTQIKIESAEPAGAQDGISVDDFMRKSQRPLAEMTKELNERIERIDNEYLKRLLKIILTGRRYEKFIRVPAGKSWHHSYLHGLLEHTLEIVRICDLMSDIHPEVNRDLLITGAILHDFGKTEELTSDIKFDYTDKGRLLGHIVIAALEVEKAAKKIEWFPEELKNQLLHLILSHQGKLEYASPVVPKTLEAVILYYADELSAKTNAYKNMINADVSEGNWTKFVPLAETQIYKKRKFDDEEES